jgi:hypothetical protein
MSKEGMSIGNAPVLGKQAAPSAGGPMPNPYGSPMPNPYGGPMPNPYGPPMAGGQIPYGMPSPQFQQFGTFGPMQGPRMEMMPPPPPTFGGPFPSHPFIRSPRDFFMWGETMEDERARGNRPSLVP